MKNLITLSAILALAPLCASAQMYVRASAVWQEMDDIEIDSAEKFAASVDESFGFSGAVGYEFSVFTAEIEALSISNEIVGDNDPAATNMVKGDVDQYRIFANAYFTIPGIPVIDPYIGAGFGLAHFTLNDFGVESSNSMYAGDGDSNVLGVQFMAGLKVNLPVTGLYVYGGYRFVRWDGYDQEIDEVDDPDTTAVEEGNSTISFNSSHMFELGAGYRF